MNSNLGFQSIVPAGGIMLPIGGAETSVRRRFLGSLFLGNLQEQAAGLPVFDQVECRTRSTIAAEKLVAGVPSCLISSGRSVVIVFLS
jgi:hypothetical protein